MIRLTVEETNLLSIYNEGGKRGLMENINAALPFMDEDMRELAKRTLAKMSIRSLPFSPLMRYDRAKAAYAAPKPESQQPCKKGVLQLR